MEFAGGMCVYPGGGVDPRDFDADVGVGRSGAGGVGERLGCDEEMARALVCAAVRETFEESGVLLAGPHGDEVVADTTGDGLGGRPGGTRVARAGDDRLPDPPGPGAPHRPAAASGARWLTPVFEPRRYRTWFFVALLPDGQRTRDVSPESSEVAWLPAADAVAMADGARC